MGSTSRSLAKVIRECRDYQKLVESHNQSNDYWRGVYNGMELLLAKLDIRDPKFIAPEGGITIQFSDDFSDENGVVHK